MIPVMSEEVAVRREIVPMNILIVDDEMSIRETCATVSEQCGMKAVAVATADEALQVLEHSAIDILLTDLKLQQSSGVDLLKQVHDLHPEVAAVVLTQYGTIETAMEATRMGAADYVTKPFHMEELRAQTGALVRAMELDQENRVLREQLRTRPGFGGLIGVSAQDAARVQDDRKSQPAQLSGADSGRERHGQGTGGALAFISAARGKNKPFVPVDCSALVPTLIESELFGYVKGAFTGAQQAQAGTAGSGATAARYFWTKSATAGGPAGQAAARLAGARDSAGGLDRTGAHRRAHHRRHQSRSGSGHPHGRLPPGSLFPAERRADQAAAAARAQERHPAAGQLVSLRNSPTRSAPRAPSPKTPCAA